MNNSCGVFQKRLVETRRNMGMQQCRLAELVGCTKATLSGYENGTINPSFGNLIKIAEICNVSIDWLCGIDAQVEERENNKTNTYGYFVLSLVKLCDQYPKVFSRTIEKETASLNIHINDRGIVRLFQDLEKMFALLKKGDITESIFWMWLENACEKIDMVICTDTEGR